MIIAVSTFIVGATSCKKDYTCTCTAFGFSATEDFQDLSKSEADDKKAECESVSACTWSVK